MPNETFQLPEVTYIDADLMFFQSPSILLDEFHQSGWAILLTESIDTPPAYDQSKISGIYCVQFITFEESGIRTGGPSLEQEQCLSESARIEDGKFR